MNLLIYILVYPLIWFISKLPFRVLYTISDFFYFLIFYVIRYRKKVVLENLKLAFPEKSMEELFKIRKKFYSHFVDIFCEMIKSFTISQKELAKHCVYPNIDLLNDLYEDGKSIVLIGSHYGNWEWLFGLSGEIKYKSYTAFTRVSNHYFNNKILKSRGRFGFGLEQTSKIISRIDYNVKNNIQSMFGLLSDQSPQFKKAFYWNEFLGVRVPIHTGAEMLAKKYDMSLVYIETTKVRRGYYESNFTILTKNPNEHPDYELTDIFLEKVEQQIRKQPEYYFWTHKRFKHSDKEPK